jgi:hypothetical protein
MPATVANSSISVAFSGIPAGSLIFEVTCVFEYDPTVSGGGLVSSTVPPRSNNTLAQVLRSLGPATTWAYNTIGSPVIKAAAGYASAVVGSAVSQVQRSVAMMALV